MAPEITLNGEKVDRVEGFGQPVALAPEVESALLNFLDEHKDDEEYIKFVEGGDKAKLDNMMESGPLSPARERLNKLRAQRGNLIQEVEIEGETWFVKRLSWPELLAVSTLVTKLQQAPSRTTLMRDNLIAMLAHCVVTDATAEAQPYFDIDFTPDGTPVGTAVEYADEPAAATTVNALFDYCVELTPDLFPKAKGTAEKAESTSGASSVPTLSTATNSPEGLTPLNTTAPA